MRKIFILVLAALMLITALFGCNNQPVPTPNDDTQVQQPETTNPGTTPGGVTNPPSGDTGDTVEYEKTSTYEVGDGQFVFKESKYEYDGNNLVIMNVKNKTSQNYTLTIHYTCYDESGAEVLSETRKYDGFAANYSQNILLLPMKPFDTYSYTIETAPYSGVCFGAKHSLEWVGLAEDISDIKGDMYEHLASIHDMFLLKPFTDTGRYVFPVFDEDADQLSRLFSRVERALREQTDWYWSCRSRSYFMEMMLLLERTYGLIEQNEAVGCANQIQNPHLKKAVIYIENNYRETVTLENVVKAASLNHSTLTQLFKAELNMTPIEYLWHHRLVVAKKFLEFTELPVGEIASRCGFKTTQHFSRKFEEKMGSNPSTFRSDAVATRKKSF